MLAWQPVVEAREWWQVAVTDDATSAHDQALARVAAELPRDSTVVVDNTYWNDLVEAGWDPEDVIWFYKVDSDPAVSAELGNDYQTIDYMVWSRESMGDLAPIVKEAYDTSDLVWAVGQGDERVELREIVTREEQRARESRARQDFALEMRALELYLAAPSDYEGLTNGQVEAIVEQTPDSTPAEVADTFGTTTETVTEIMEDKR